MKKSVSVLLIMLLTFSFILASCSGEKETYIQNTSDGALSRALTSLTDITDESTTAESYTSESSSAESSSSSAFETSTQVASATVTQVRTEPTTAGTTISVTTSTRMRLKDRLTKNRQTTASQTSSAAPKPILHGSAFFDDAVFVGDSVTLGLSNYVSNERAAGRECLGKAQFLCSGSMSYSNSRGAVGAKNTIHPKYNGKEVLIEDGIKLCGAKKVFIMLGMNDFSAYNLDFIKNNIRDTLDKIIAKNPGVTIYIESVTPIAQGKEHGKFTNAGVDAFNDVLKGFCKEYGLQYVDVNSHLKDSAGCFKAEYCGDNGTNGMGIHMNPAGSKAWIDFLVNNF